MTIRGLSSANTWLLARLSRITSTGRFVPEIDGLRFFAIVSVVLFHLNGYVAARAPESVARAAAASGLSQFLAHGSIGVRLFFVLSGFILTVPFAEHHLEGGRAVPLGKYFARRLSRLEPPYVANLLVLAAAIIATQTPVADLGQHLVASMLYLHNIVYGDGSTVNHVAWSLEVEIQWYILAPLACTVFMIKRPAIRRAILVAAIVTVALVAQALDVDTWPRLGRTLAAYAHFFAAGMLLADLHLTIWATPATRRRRWDLFGAAGWIALVPLDANAATKPLVVLAIIIAYAGAFRGAILNAIVRQPWIATIGGMCYSIYLYHSQIISAVARISIRWVVPGSFGGTLAIQCAIVLPVVFLASSLAFVLLERPFMARDWPRRAWRRGRELVGTKSQSS